MPIEFEFDVQAQRIRTVARGRMDDDELRHYLDAVHNAPGYDPSFDELLDLRAVEGVDVTTQGIRQAALAMKQYDPMLVGARVAVIAESDAAFGLARMYQAHRTGPDAIRVFRTEAEAQHWLAEPRVERTGPR